MQSLSLISDMEAFKAANPGCKLEDFVRYDSCKAVSIHDSFFGRWHSPRDWILNEETQQYTLSERMTHGGGDYIIERMCIDVVIGFR